MLIEFASAVDAVRCAIAVQKVTADRSADVPRIGECCSAWASISATCWSGTTEFSGAMGSRSPYRLKMPPSRWHLPFTAAYAQSKDKVTAEFVNLGERQLKNWD
jgi:hypothetical protein